MKISNGDAYRCKSSNLSGQVFHLHHPDLTYNLPMLIHCTTLQFGPHTISCCQMWQQAACGWRAAGFFTFGHLWLQIFRPLWWKINKSTCFWIMYALVTAVVLLALIFSQIKQCTKGGRHFLQIMTIFFNLEPFCVTSIKNGLRHLQSGNGSVLLANFPFFCPAGLYCCVFTAL